MATTLDCLAAGILVADHLSAPIPRLPAAGELIEVDELPLCVGGCAANTALDLARLGVRVGVAGCVGDDVFGRFVSDTLAAAGVDTAAIVRRAGAATSGSLILNVAGEDRRFIHAQGANATLEVGDLPREAIAGARVFYLGGYLLMRRLEPAAVAALLAAARAAGARTVLDVALPGSGDHLSRVAPLLPRVAPLLPHVDVFVPNRDEAAALTGLADPLAQAERLRAAGAGTVVITCGADGAVLATAGLRVRAGVHPVDYVGGTGAGDAFSAGYIAGMLAGEDVLDCLRWGAALGASCVRALGATDGVFDRAAALAFLRGHELPIEAC